MVQKWVDLFKKRNKALLIGVFVGLALLRFINLGYSDYIPDETTVLDYLRVYDSVYTIDFLTLQRKGPIQFVVAAVPFVLGFDIFFEGAYRLLFALFNVLSIIFFYLFVKNFLNNERISFYAAFLYGVNGFIVAFGRIVQYQSLNLFFSILALYLFSLLIKGKEKNSKISFKNEILYLSFGFLSWYFSFLSHWDAVFITPVVVLMFGRYVRNSKVFFIRKSVLLLSSTLLFTMLLVLTFLPYLNHYLFTEGEMSYFQSRIGFSLFEYSEKIKEYIFRFLVYNPFVFLPFIGVSSLFSVADRKNSKYFILWFLFVSLIFLAGISKSGTHVYNIFLPGFILSGIGISWLAEWLSDKYFFGRSLQGVTNWSVVVIFAFLFLQSYLLFTDTRTEYPFKTEKILLWETKEYDHKSLSNFKIGFTHRRKWSDIRKFLDSESSTRGGEKITYVTNEDSSISNFYLGREYGISDNMYVIGIKNPYSFVKDYSYPQIKNKSTVKIIENNGNKVVRIYKVYPDNEK